MPGFENQIKESLSSRAKNKAEQAIDNVFEGNHGSSRQSQQDQTHSHEGCDPSHQHSMSAQDQCDSNDPDHCGKQHDAQRQASSRRQTEDNRSALNNPNEER
ncbi:hypothetical protein H4219_000139 [Mycoemilia scoparia]|uniref:Uncharacterized protein n=1 Tax=Mycoemilia scoparia TaxID=417184 RepID=A0A9W8AA08_9FUNG|nr:hypothetical protein H4219_000139 [Mycoemilia scoparia]